MGSQNFNYCFNDSDSGKVIIQCKFYSSWNLLLIKKVVNQKNL